MLVPLINNYLTMPSMEFNETVLPNNIEQSHELFKRKRFNKKLDKLKKSIAQRENMRFQRTRLFGLYRQIFLVVIQRLGSLSQNYQMELHSLMVSLQEFQMKI